MVPEESYTTATESIRTITEQLVGKNLHIIQLSQLPAVPFVKI